MQVPGDLAGRHLDGKLVCDDFDLAGSVLTLLTLVDGVGNICDIEDARDLQRLTRGGLLELMHEEVQLLPFLGLDMADKEFAPIFRLITT